MEDHTAGQSCGTGVSPSGVSFFKYGVGIGLAFSDDVPIFVGEETSTARRYDTEMANSGNSLLPSTALSRLR